MLGRSAALAAAGLLSACMAPQSPAGPPPHPVPADGSIKVDARAIPLDPRDPQAQRLGALVYAGGLELTSSDTGRLHGVSGLDIAADGRSFIANTDEGDLVTGRLVLAADGRLAGLDGVRLRPLRDPDGRELQGKTEGDAEDITFSPGGGFAVSFERDHRVLAYPRPGAPGQVLWRYEPGLDKVRLPDNAGLEALTAAPDGQLFAGVEAGDIHRLAGGRLERENLAPPPPQGYSLTGLDTLDGEDWIAIYRAWDPLRGPRAVIALLAQPRCIRAPCLAPHGLRELGRIGRGMSVDNFEGVAAVPTPGGRWRLYLVSDDNFSSSQRTLLLAFDWDPRASAGG